MIRRIFLLLPTIAFIGALMAGASSVSPRVTYAGSHHVIAHSKRGAQNGPPRRLSVLRLTAASTVLSYPAPPILARAAILVDERTGRVLYEKDADMRLPMASTTKITTAILALKHSHPTDVVRVTPRAASIGEATMALVKGERVRVLDLLYGLLLNSGNDAAVALAEHVGGSEAHFVQMMNQLAVRLHMRNTHYVTPHGLDARGHYTSARDLSIVSRYAMHNRLFRKIVRTESYHIFRTAQHGEHWLANINRVLFWYPGIDGVKPGQTDAAGLCQVVSVHRDGRHLLAVLLNTPNLVTDIRNLLNFGLRDFRWVRDPLWWDGPATTLSGGRGAGYWIYYLGAGHYITGPFLHYFNAHGGLHVMGYPRTDVIEEGGRQVQYFQGARLVLDTTRGSVYPTEIGVSMARAVRSPGTSGPLFVHPVFSSLFRRLGGQRVLGDPITPLLLVRGRSVQIFRYGALQVSHGLAVELASGDAELLRRGWLPANGTGDAYPPGLVPPS